VVAWWREVISGGTAKARLGTKHDAAVTAARPRHHYDPLHARVCTNGRPRIYTPLLIVQCRNVQNAATAGLPAHTRARVYVCRWPRTFHTRLPAFPLPLPLRNMQMRFIARPLPAALQPATVKRAGAIVARASSVFGRNGTRENTANRRPSGEVERSAPICAFGDQGCHVTRLRRVPASTDERVLATVSRERIIGSAACYAS